MIRRLRCLLRGHEYVGLVMASGRLRTWCARCDWGDPMPPDLPERVLERLDRQRPYA